MKKRPQKPNKPPKRPSPSRDKRRGASDPSAPGRHTIAQPPTDPAEPGLWRLDRVVRGRFDLSWGKARERIERGKIWLSGAPVLDIGLPVAPDVELDFVPHAPVPRHHELRLSAEIIRALDRDLVLVEKPTGLLTVPYLPGDQDTLKRLLPPLLARLERRDDAQREARRGDRRRPQLPRVQVVHRLDRSTSGLLVFARSALAYNDLKEQFRAHTVHRRYLALVEGHPASQTIKSHLLRDRGDGRRGSLERAPARLRAKLGEGKLAITHIEVIERLTDATLVACRLETGRTNQIRIHLAELGHPLLGETTYLPAHTPHRRARRLCLHAAELGFVHPRSGEPAFYRSEIPAEMQAEIDARS